MAVNKKNTRKAPAFSAARKTALAGVSRAAFNSGVARSAVIAATAAAAGNKPVLSLYNAIKVELQVGFMAAALARKGDNRPEAALIEHCRDRLANYAGFGGTGKLKAGQKGRRTKVEEDAYTSARVLVSGVMRDAGVKVPETRGGNTSKTRKPQAGKVAPKAANNNAKPAIVKQKDAAAFNRYVAIQAAALLANCNKNAKIVSPAMSSAISDFVAAVKAATPAD